MSKATVLSTGADGLYRVRVDYGTAQRDAELVRLDQLIASLGLEIEGLETSLAAFKAEEEAPAEAEVNAAQAAYIAASKATPRDDSATKAAIEAHSAAIKVLFDVRSRYAMLSSLIDERKVQRADTVRRRGALAAAVVEEEQDAWCADYTLDAVGDVAAIAVPGENQRIVIAPGAPAPADEFGQLLARELQSGPQAFFNAAILPGWQRWMPTHRTGTVTAVDVVADTVDVTLTAASSSAQSLPINEPGALSAVPVRYMTCNAAAFVVGDRALVAFDGQSWDAPRVIGFADHPRPCNVVYVSADYKQVVDLPEGEQEVYFWGFVSLVDVMKREVMESWYIPNPWAFDGVVSVNGQPYLARAGSQAGHHAVLDDATGGPGVGLPDTLQSVQQSGDRFFGLYMLNSASDGFDFRTLVEMEMQAGSLAETGRWTVGGGDAGLTTASPSAGHIAIGGYLGVGAYGVRVFDIETRSLVFQVVLPSIVESVDLTPNYLCIAHWGPGNTVDEITIYRRTEAGYALLSSTGVGRQVFSVAVVRDYVVATDDEAVYIWRLNHETGALSDFAQMMPYGAQLAALPGNEDYSEFMPVGSGVSGHNVTAIVRP